MKSRSQRLPLTGLRSIQNERSRIYVPGSDPLFSRAPRSKTTFRVVPAFPEDQSSAEANSPLSRQEVVDRLEAPLTRYHE